MFGIKYFELKPPQLALGNSSASAAATDIDTAKSSKAHIETLSAERDELVADGSWVFDYIEFAAALVHKTAVRFQPKLQDLIAHISAKLRVGGMQRCKLETFVASFPDAVWRLILEEWVDFALLMTEAEGLETIDLAQACSIVVS